MIFTIQRIILICISAQCQRFTLNIKLFYYSWGSPLALYYMSLHPILFAVWNTYCSYKTAQVWQTQSQWELVLMMVSFPCLYWSFQLSVTQIIVSTPRFCLLCLFQKDLCFCWNELFIQKKVSQLQIAKVPFKVTWLVLRPWQIFIFLCDFNNWIFLLIGQLLIYLLHSLCSILTCEGEPLVLGHDGLYTEVSFHLK